MNAPLTTVKQVAKENRRKSKKKETLEEEQDERLVQAEKIGEVCV